MWRSLFFAAGIFLFIAGLQCLVFQEFYVNRNNKLFSIVKKAGQTIGGDAPAQNFQPQPSQIQQRVAANSPANTGPFSLPSSYYGGPSRFQSNYNRSPIAQTNFGAASSGAGQGGSDVRGFNASNLGLSSGNEAVGNLKRYPVNDWMPWCLLAVGTIVCLYTKSVALARNAE